MNRRLKERIIRASLGLITLIACLLLVFILATVLWQGLPALKISFLLEESRDFGKSGGILYQALGTLLLMIGAVVLCLPVALGSVLFQTEFLHSAAIKKFLRLLIYSLNGVPTIIFGLVGYVFFGLLLDTGVSWVTGTLILAVMILPTLHVSFQEAVESVPLAYREAGLALGLTPWQLIRSVIVPQSVYGIVTGMLLGLARAAGETAAIMFTATTFAGIRLPESWSDPVPTLQTHILILAQEAVSPQALTNAWGAGLVLLTLVFILIAATLLIRTRLPMESDR